MNGWSKGSELTDSDPILAEVVDTECAAPHGESCDSCGSPIDAADTCCGACGASHAVTAQAVQPNLHSNETTHIPGSLEAKSADDSAPDASEYQYDYADADYIESGAGGGAGDTGQDDRSNQRFVECNNCGSTVSMDADKRSYVCAFCDSSYVVEYSPEVTGRRRTDFIIGFAITPDQAHEKFTEWITDNAWFRPGDLDQARVDERLVGVYLPFWSFSMLAKSDWSASIGEHWYRTERYTVKNAQGKTETRTRRVQETEWWPLSGKHQRYYTGYLVSASRSLTQKEADQIKPYQLPAIKRYEPYFLAGWLCEEYSISHQDALATCQDVFLHQEHSNVAAFMPGDTHRSLDVNTWFSYIHSDLCLLPAYVWSYRYRDKLYRFVVNGQTGRVAGKKPVSKTRITLLVVAIVILIAIIVAAVLLSGAGR